MYEKFNTPDTLGIISSFPIKGGELARGNAISRYTYLLTKNFPDDQNVVIFCEAKNARKPYLIAQNILVVPTYRLNSVRYFSDVLVKVVKFDAIRNILIEFEFSIFGGKIIIPQILILLATLKLFGKSTKIMFHQVVTNINTLSGHLVIKKDGFKARVLNILLTKFYKMCGLLADKVIVHDRILAGRISKLINRSKISVIPHGISIENKISKEYISKSKNHFRLKKGVRLIGIFGYCSWYKGTDWLIENFARFARENRAIPVKLLVAGGESPTLKGTSAYKKYHERLKKVVKEANGDIIYTGYVPDNDVKKVFAATDMFIFPYRTKMSASGAFSLCLGYKKPYLVSKSFSENIEKNESEGRTFSLNYESFSTKLIDSLKSSKPNVSNLNWRSWKNAANLCLKECLPGFFYLPKLEYAQAY